MIKFNSLVGIEEYGLNLQNNILTINKSLNDFIFIDKSIKIIINENVNVKILDCSKCENIDIEIKNNSFLTYQIINSVNTKRFIKCYGELSITEICLDESKENINIELLNENASVNYDLLALGNDYNLDFIQNIEHCAPLTNSNISNFGVVLNNSDILFDTTGKINKGMCKSKCVQLSKGIIIDDESNITSKPILLIDEYDVVANHGASIGKMSDESLFYLMSRGLSKQDAFLLILEGIVSPFISKIVDENIKSEIKEKIEKQIMR